jgi:hypothetical protein
LVGNSGNFIESTPLIWSNNSLVGRASSRADVVSALCADSFEPQARHYNNEHLASPSAFACFLHFSDWLHARTNRTDGIALMRLMELLFEFLTAELHLNPKPVAETLWRDYRRCGRHDKPGFLKAFLSEENAVPLRKPGTALPKRQARHLHQT